MDSWTEGPIKYFLSVCPEFFYGITYRNFLIFWMKLGWSNVKSDSDIFLKEVLFCFKSKEQKMDPKWGFSTFMKTWHSLLWFFASTYSSIHFMIFFGKKFFLKFLDQRRPKMRPKWSFLSFVKNQCMELFWFSAWSYSSIKT